MGQNEAAHAHAVRQIYYKHLTRSWTSCSWVFERTTLCIEHVDHSHQNISVRRWTSCALWISD